MANKFEAGKIETHTFQGGTATENFYGWFYKTRGKSMQVTNAAVAQDPQQYTLVVEGQLAMVERKLNPEVITVVTYEGSKANTAIKGISQK